MTNITFPTTEATVTLEPSGQVLTGAAAITFLTALERKGQFIESLDESTGVRSYFNLEGSCICRVDATFEEGTEQICVPAIPIEQLCVTIPDCDAPEAPVVTAVTGNTTDGYIVTGTSEVGATINIKNSAGTVIGTATVASNGTFSVTLPGTTGANTTIYVIATDSSGNVSAPTVATTPSNS